MLRDIYSAVGYHMLSDSTFVKKPHIYAVDEKKVYREIPKYLLKLSVSGWRIMRFSFCLSIFFHFSAVSLHYLNSIKMCLVVHSAKDLSSL